MPLVHYKEQPGNTPEENSKLRFYWAYIRQEVAKDGVSGKECSWCT